MMNRYLITCVALAFILIVFLYYAYQLWRIYKANKTVRDIYGREEVMDALFEDHRLRDIASSYKCTISISTSTGRLKSNTPSQEFFNELSVLRAFNLNPKQLDAASSILVGLGLLGTFLGLTIGILNFKSDTSEQIQISIQTLLAGMGTAFATSLEGMLFSLTFTFFDKRVRNRLAKHLKTLTDKLDVIYYIDDVTLMIQRQQAMVDRLYAGIRTQMDAVVTKMNDDNAALKTEIIGVATQLNDCLTYTNEKGENANVGTAIREIVRESSQQTAALKSFSTDLADSLQNVFDEVLSNQMKERLLPVLKEVDSTTKLIVEHIDKVAETVTTPAADMMKSVVDELRSVVERLMNEFKTNFSDAATAGLDKVSSTLGVATQAIEEFPKRIDLASVTLQDTVNEVRSAISEISTSSASANTEAMKQMQEQVSLAAKCVGEAISEVKTVMENLTYNSVKTNEEAAKTLANASEEVSQMLKLTISQVSESVQRVMDSIANDISSKQLDLLSIQEDVVSSTKQLMEQFNVSLERMETMNEYLTETMGSFRQTQEHISGSTSNLQIISSKMKDAAEDLTASQAMYSNQLQEEKQNIESILKTLKDTSEMGNDYVEKFSTIKNGLTAIFQQLQNGLSEYSKTVHDSTQKYLDQYSTSLTNATDALGSTVQQQNELVELLAETIDDFKRR